ncbi:MAG: atoE 1 [Firmicutes bacterium]|nr:atoE 1 [Bacillota bacterium]
MADTNTLSKENQQNGNGLINKFTELALNWIPDSMVFVLALTVGIFAAALVWGTHAPIQLIDDYEKSFWRMLPFAMQMSLLMITGFVVADSKPAKRIISAIIDIPKTPKMTMWMFMVVGGFVSWCHWGIGLMLNIVMGRELAARKRGLGIHYAFLVAVCYGCGSILSNGPTQMAPLLVATPGHFLEKLTGIIPITQTALSPFQFAYIGILFVTLPLVMLMFMPSPKNSVEISEELANEFLNKDAEEVEDKSKLRPAERWDRSPILQVIVALIILFWFAKAVYFKGANALDLNNLNLAFFGLGLLLHGNPRSFIKSVRAGVPTTYGVIIQFPLYAGIFGVISDSGLAKVITHWFVSISTPGTYAWIIFLYTGVMDFFVPSAGSKFVIEAPYIIPAAQQLGVPIQQVILGYNAGAQWVNNLQPFWALPVLAAFKLRFQDIMPFTFLIWLWVGIVSTVMFLLFPMGFGF